MLSKINPKYTTILLHLIVWSTLFVLPHLFISSDSRVAQPGFFPSSFFIITNLYHIGLFYLNAFVLYPHFFNKRKWWLFILSAITIVAGSYYLKLLLTKQWFPEVVLDK